MENEIINPNQQKKCSIKDHKEVDAIYFCNICKIYMCNRCQNLHLQLFPEHPKIILEKNQEEIFTGICTEKGHQNKLSFFCKTHNQLCCAACISKIQNKEFGQHSNCETCEIEEIKEEKFELFEENVQYLEKILKTFEDSIKELEELYKTIQGNKEQLKINVQKIFCEIKVAIDKRQDEILLDIENKFKESYFDEDLIIKSKKLPKKIKNTLEKGKSIEEKWNNKDELCFAINNSLSIEKDNDIINEIYEKINKCKELNIEIFFNPKEDEISNFIDSLNEFGSIEINNFGKKEIKKEQKKEREKEKKEKKEIQGRKGRREGRRK